MSAPDAAVDPAAGVDAAARADAGAAPAHPTVLPAVPRSGGPGVDEIAFPDRAHYVELVRGYRDAGFELCADLCAVDYLSHPGRQLPEPVTPERFEVVVNLVSLSEKRRVRVRVQVPESDPRLGSLIDVYPGVDAMEREAFDLLGVRFEGHPDLTRILMPEDWEGHPLRKDYGVGRVPVQFKEAPGPR